MLDSLFLCAYDDSEPDARTLEENYETNRDTGISRMLSRTGRSQVLCEPRRTRTGDSGMSDI